MTVSKTANSNTIEFKKQKATDSLVPPGWGPRLLRLCRVDPAFLRRLAGQLWANVIQDDLTGRAAQLAYYFFLSLFPGLIFISSVIGLIAGSQTGFRNHLLEAMATFLPPAAYTLVSSTFMEVMASSTAGKAVLGALFALWTATSGMSALQDTLNGVCNLKETRPLWKSTLVALVLTIVVANLAVVAIIAFFYGGALVELIAAQTGLSSSFTFLSKLAQWPIAIFFLSLMFAVIYHFAPDRKRQNWAWLTPGSIVGMLGWLAVSGIFRAYLHFFNHYSVTYGSLGGVIILLLWFYLTGLMVLLGAELNSTLLRMSGSSCEPMLPSVPQAPKANTA